jgi:hypothetical protein
MGVYTKFIDENSSDEWWLQRKHMKIVLQIIKEN